MIRSIAIGFALALAAPAFLSAPAAAQPPAEEPRLWWNDPGLIEKVGLDAGQRAKMDGAYEKFQSASTSRAPAARAAFEAALRDGRWAEARKQLDAWMDQQGAPTRAFAELKIDVLSLLRDEQRKRLFASVPGLLEASWRPRPSWVSEAQPTPKPAR